MIPRNLILSLVWPNWAFCFFSSSKSSTASSQSSQTSTTYNTTDKRVGVEGEGNVIAGEGAQVEISVTDVSDQLAETAARVAADTARAAIAGNSDVSVAAIRGNADAIGRAAALSSDALAANIDVSRRALDSADRSVATVAETFVDLSAGQTRLLGDLAKSNAQVTETTIAGTNDLARSLVEKYATTLADNKADPSNKTVENVAQYFAIAAAVAAVAYFLTRKTA